MSFSELATEDDKLCPDRLMAEMQSIVKIEPQLYFWRMPTISQQYNQRAGRTADQVAELAAKMPFAGDVFWMHDHRRIGGAEKALAWVAEFLAEFRNIPYRPTHAVWIDDIIINHDDREACAQWGHGITHLLRSWIAEGDARSLHICNTGIGWQALINNPAIFDGIEIYLYLFNDDLVFSSPAMDRQTMGFVSPIYSCMELLDRPNIHLITDSDHHSRRLAEMTGLGDKIRKIAVPVRGMPNKRKAEPDGHTDILWAGRLDHMKGIESLLEYARSDPGVSITVYGDGKQEFVQQLIGAPGIIYGGRYDSFDRISGKYDFFLVTSEREGMPNVAREALASGLPVLAKKIPWTAELPAVRTYSGSLDCGIDEMIQNTDYDICLPDTFNRESCEPLAIDAFKEAISSWPERKTA